jgi:hypothetical protein
MVGKCIAREGARGDPSGAPPARLPIVRTEPYRSMTIRSWQTVTRLLDLLEVSS